MYRADPGVKLAHASDKTNLGTCQKLAGGEGGGGNFKFGFGN